MSDVKTKVNDASVEDFLNAVAHPVKKADSFILLEMMTAVTGVAPKMWGDSIVGFDSYHYVYASGREGDWPMVGFSPRKQNISLYIMPGFVNFDDLLKKLGKHKTSKACLYINKLADVDLDILKELIQQSVDYMRNKYHK
ncbi:hypothetical protein GCM10011344_06240 [Dokdonia pacifica]|uniref:YdhG-like domain-containing protein n=1 Tax=Dokdonia pacifica TaxID=1627892 RepID=A0A238ZUN0_9FLAO|nr:DUF1801 domain-containing protein [Dokdonia pacifica]GGG08443.1 hypothetical protein GCM10011344_06240 [Dokdonia pacifica]SNR86484.1 protein of unknown function (DU1801) [Dokdonia pacifica]